MNNKALTLALVMAALAVFFVESYVTSIEEEARRKLGTEVLVVKAKRDIKEVATITEADLTFDVMPKAFVEPSAIFFAKRQPDQDSIRTLKGLAGAVALIPIKAGEQITYNKITEPGMRTGLGAQVAPGKRAVAVAVSGSNNVSKLLKPGDRVDVMASLDLGQSKQNKVTKTILQDVFVLAVGKNVSGDVAREVLMEGNREKVKNLNEENDFSSVTLEVDPVQAAYLAAAVANNESGISLVLRNGDDPDRMQVPAVTLDDLLGADAQRMNRGPAKK